MIIPIVEGQSEERAIGGLLRRLIADEDAWVDVARPFRVKRQRVVRDGELERAIAQAVRSRSGGTGVLVVLDADDDCPADLGAVLRERGEQACGLEVRVVLPKIEIEAWVLAGIESVRGVRGVEMTAAVPVDPEAIRDAKGALTARMEGDRGYVATDDLPAFFAHLDLALVAERSRSFRKFRGDVRSLIA